MSGVRVRYSVGDVHVGLSFGDVQFITTHKGMDGVEYADVRCQHGLFQMTSDSLAVLVRRAQEALVGGKPLPNCSGALADLGDNNGVA